MFVCPECGQRYERAGYCTSEGTELAASTDPMLGTEIDRYRLARVLGEGGMGRVYLGIQPAIGSRVAIKVLSEECARNADLLDRFFAEAKAVNLIRHENIVSVLDLAVLPDGRPFIIMEFIEGHTLSHFVRNAHAPLGGVAQVMGEVLSGLAAAHAIGIVHRDLKPDNVLVTVEGHAKVLDFGIAKLAPGLRADVSPRTKTGALLGTPAYMAPEQISGAQNVDARTDIYAAGVVLYEAMTSKVPFSGTTMFDLMRAHLEEEPPPPRSLRPDIPSALEEVTLQALAKDPEHRFQSATAMAQALAHSAASLAPEQWQPLSTRGGPRISAPRIGGAPLRAGSTARDSHGLGVTPAEKQPMADELRATAVAPGTHETPATHDSRSRRGMLFGAIALVAIATGVAVLVLGGPDDPEVAAAADSALALEPSAASADPDPRLEGAPAPGPELAPASTSADEAPTPHAGGAGSADGAVGARGVGGAGRAGNAAVAAGAGGTSTAKSPAQRSATRAGDRAASERASTATSASDPSGHVAPNVHIGQGGAIGGPPAAPPSGGAGGPPAAPPPASPMPGQGAALGKTTISQPADYNPRRFDPVAYLPKALALARKLIPDAQLTSFEFDPVFPDGRVDLTMAGRDREYIFRSPAKSARPAGVPRNVPVERACMVYVEVGAREITATIRKSEDCDDRIVRHPRCRFSGVWKQALANGTPSDVVARIGWLYDEKWFFDVDLEGKGGGVSSFPDRCP